MTISSAKNLKKKITYIIVSAKPNVGIAVLPEFKKKQ